MKATYIDYKDTQSFSKTLLAYLDNEEALAPFYGNRPDWRLISRTDQEQRENLHRALLHHSLREQYGESLLSSFPEVAENITRLSDSKTFAVTTGHPTEYFYWTTLFHFQNHLDDTPGARPERKISRLSGLYPSTGWLPKIMIFRKSIIRARLERKCLGTWRRPRQQDSRHRHHCGDRQTILQHVRSLRECDTINASGATGLSPRLRT